MLENGNEGERGQEEFGDEKFKRALLYMLTFGSESNGQGIKSSQ